MCEDQLYGESAFEIFNWAIWLEEMIPLTVIGKEIAEKRGGTERALCIRLLVSLLPILPLFTE